MGLIFVRKCSVKWLLQSCSYFMSNYKILIIKITTLLKYKIKQKFMLEFSLLKCFIHLHAHSVLVMGPILAVLGFRNSYTSLRLN